MAIKGTLYGLAKTKNDVDGLEKFKSMIKEVNSSGAVVIDGRNIAADSIFANQISADAITAKQIKAGAITTDHITTSGISADKIKAGQLTAQNNASWLNLNNGQFSFGGGKIVYNGSTLSINVESLKITNKPVATAEEVTAVANSKSDKINAISGGGKVFKNPLNQSRSQATITGALVIKTPITNNYMTKISISGYNFKGSISNIDLDVSFYAYQNNTFLEHSYINKGNYPVEKVRLARDSAGRTVIIIGTGGSVWNYPKVQVTEATIGYTTPPDSYQDGWSLDYVTTLDAYTAIVDMPYGTDYKNEINSAQTDATNAKGKTDAWTYTGTTEINGGKIKADTVTAAQIAANTITATQIKALTITASEIAANAINADKILANAITTVKIATNAVTANEIKANTITAKEIAAGTLTANEIKAGAITVDKIAVGDFTNYAAWDKTAGTYPLQKGALDTSVFRSSRGSIKLSPGQIGNLKSDIEVVFGESIYYEYWIKTDANWNGTANNSKFRIGDQNNGLLVAVGYNGPKTGWTKFSGNYTVASSVYALKMSFGNDGTVGNVWIDDVVIKKKTSGELIVDGSITADHITTLGITADKIKAGRLSATNNVSWLDMNNGQFNFGNGKISFNGSILALNVDSLSIASKPVATKEQVDASILDDKKIKDTRSTNQPPSWYFTNYPTQVVNEFKQRAVVGAPGTQTYGVLTTDVIWSGTSGGFITQTFKSGDGVFTRNGQTTGWTSWLQIDIEDRINNAVTTIDKTGVTVKDGSFFLEDNISDVKYSIVDKQNYIYDHSFESVELDLKNPTISSGGDTLYNPKFGTNHSFISGLKAIRGTDWWATGNIYFTNMQYTEAGTKSSIHGKTSPRLSNIDTLSNFYYQFTKGQTLTLSAFSKRCGTLAAGALKVTISLVNLSGSGQTTQIATKTFPTVNSDPNIIRRDSMTFTLPSSYNPMTHGVWVRLEGANGNWAYVDGIQLVDGDVPSVYDPEVGLSNLVTGRYTAKNINVNKIQIVSDNSYIMDTGGVLDLANGDITGANGIFFNDIYENTGEGLNFLKRGKMEGSLVKSDYDMFGILDGNLSLNGVATGDLLWNGAVLMHETHTITPSKKMSDCMNGWILVWSGYSGGAAQNYNWNYVPVPKLHGTRHSGNGVMFNIIADGGKWNSAGKYVYITDTNLKGYGGNTTSFSSSMVLREVLAW